MKLNLGCGRDRIPGWEHVDRIDYGDNVIFDLDHLTGSGRHLPYPDYSCEEFKLHHVLEHLRDTLGLMEELWRVALPGAICHVAVPFAFSEESIEDQTHVRQFTFNSFCFFSQPVYCNADYGYRGDWDCPEVRAILRYPWPDNNHERMLEAARMYRNVVKELIADLVAVKPARPQKAELVRVPQIVFV